MVLSEKKNWVDDLEKANTFFGGFGSFSRISMLITGGTGLIGSAIVDLLIQLNESYNAGIRIYAAGRDEKRMRERFGIYVDKSYFKFVKYDALEDISGFPEQVDYIIHGAGNAYPSVMTKEPVETMEANFSGTMRLLKYANQVGCKRFLFISSSEVYGIKKTDDPFKEDDYGFVDLLNPRNSYSTGKRAGETLCASFLAEYGLETVIVRPGHIYGPTASRKDNRVSSNFAYLAAEGKDIIMKSAGTQIRSYVYCVDCATAVLTVLLKGEPGRAYNISNPDSVISIREMAERLASAGKVGIVTEMPNENEKKAFNPMNNSSLDSSKLLDLGWKGLFDAETGLTHTVEILKEMNAN